MAVLVPFRLANFRLRHLAAPPARRYTWVDDDTILCNVIPEGVGAPPSRPPAPTGPRIQDNATGTKV